MRGQAMGRKSHRTNNFIVHELKVHHLWMRRNNNANCQLPTDSWIVCSEIESVHIHWQEIRIMIIGEIAWVESSTIHLSLANSERVQPHNSVQMAFDLALVLRIGHEFNPFVVNLSVLFDLLVVRLFTFPFLFPFFVIYYHGNAQRIRINRLRTKIFSCVFKCVASITKKRRNKNTHFTYHEHGMNTCA